MREALRRVAASGGLPAALLIIAVAAWLAFNPALFNDGDTSWHLATGRWILDHRAIPHADPFSYTFRGQPWTAHEWLADLVMGSLYATGGWAALAIFFALCVAAMLAIMGAYFSRFLAPRHVLLVLALVVALLAPYMLARPHVIAWPLLAGWVVLLLGAREQHRAPTLPWALLVLLWSNLHGSFIFALLLAAAFALEALIAEKSDRRGVVIGWGLFGLACLVASIATPHGFQGLLFPLQVGGMKALPLIDEWRATDPVSDWLFTAFCALTAIVAVLRWRRVPIVRVLLLIFVAAMAFAHARHQPLFAILATLLLVPALAKENRRASLLPAAAVAVGVLMVVAVRLVIPLHREDGATYPASAIAALPPQLRTEPVLNDYGFGGPLILNGVAPFIDGRADLYGDDFTIAHERIIRGDRALFDRAQVRWGFRWTILQPSAPLVTALDRDRGWRRAYADEWAVVHVRR